MASNYTYDRNDIQRLTRISLNDYFFTDDMDNIPPITIDCAFDLLGQLSEKYKSCMLMQLSEPLNNFCQFLFGINLEFNQQTQEKLKDVYIRCMKEITRVEKAFTDNVRLNDKEENDIKKKINICRSILEHCYHHTQYILDAGDNIYTNPYNISSSDNDNLHTHQLLCIKLAETFRRLKYKKDLDGNIYLPIYFEITNSETGEEYKQNSFAYEKKGTIDEFIRAMMNPNTHRELWKNFTEKLGYSSYVIKQMETTHMDDFPIIKTDRHIFSCRNGVYICGPDHCRQKDGPFKGQMRPIFMTYKEVEDKKIFKDGICAANFIDVEVDQQTINAVNNFELKDLKPQEELVKIFKDQDIPMEAIMWIFIMLGRLVYEVCECDRWEIIPFIKGHGGTGKSTIGNLILSI